MKRQTKMISWTKNSLKEHGQEEKLNQFNAVINNAFTLTQRKRSVQLSSKNIIDSALIPMPIKVFPYPLNYQERLK